MQSNPGRHNTLLVFILSFSAFCFELVLTRIFSVLMWYHFASLAIGLAMLGFGAGGVLAYFFKDRITEKVTDTLLIIYFSLFLVIHLLFYYVHWAPSLIAPVLAFFHQPYYQPFQRGVFFSLNAQTIVLVTSGYALFTLPFIFAGTLIAVIFKRNYMDAHTLYRADLIGAAASSVFLAVILYYLSPLTLLSLVAVTGFLYLMFARKDNRTISSVLCFFSIVLIIGGIFFGGDEIPIARGKVSNDIFWTRWNAFSRVVLYPIKGEEREKPFGQSLYYKGFVPQQWGLLVDDTGYTVASEFPDTSAKQAFFQWNLVSLPYVVNKEKVLIIGPGGGKDIFCALSMGVPASQVTAVELNPLVVMAVDDVLGNKTQKLYGKVRTFIQEGRSFVERDIEQYSVIQATSVYGRIPPAAGIFTFAEDNLYTLEAFKTYIGHLHDGGYLAVSRFIYEKTIPKLILLSMQTIKNVGNDQPERSLFLAKERGLSMLLVKKGVFEKAETELLKRFCDDKGFTVLYEPFGEYDNPYAEMILKKNGMENAILPTDDRPFYYYNLSGKDFVRSMILGGDSFEERGILILKVFFFLSFLFVIILILLPMILRRHNTAKETGVLYGAYFFLLGVGYILVEIVLIKGFSLFLETPVYSMIFVVGTMLCASGIGAQCTGRLRGDNTIYIIFSALIVLICLMGFELVVVNKILRFALFYKICITVVMLAVLGFFMGMPFPYMLVKLGMRDNTLVAWALAVNSAASVIGSFLSLMLVVNIGFRNSLFVAGAVYGSALLILVMLRRRSYEN